MTVTTAAPHTCEPPPPAGMPREAQWPCPRCGTWFRLARPWWWQRAAGSPAWHRVIRER